MQLVFHESDFLGLNFLFQGQCCQEVPGCYQNKIWQGLLVMENLVLPPARRPYRPLAGPGQIA
jgi:hypothetical protein